MVLSLCRGPRGPYALKLAVTPGGVAEIRFPGRDPEPENSPTDPMLDIIHPSQMLALWSLIRTALDGRMSATREQRQSIQSSTSGG